MKSLDFDTLRKANITRLPLFKNKHGGLVHSKADGSCWSPAEWLEAVLGELGELAGQQKKMRRGDFDGLGGMAEAHDDLAKEFADVAIYLDLFAYQYRIDLGEAIRAKFNEVSDRVDVPVKISNDNDVYDPEPVVLAYPDTTVEDYTSGPRDEGRGSKVETLPTGDLLGSIDDLQFFVERLSKALGGIFPDKK
jgi:NTP pyrophosphatase (non-canonical NTP hydrolase)